MAICCSPCRSVLPVSTAHDVSVGFAVPGRGSDTLGTKDVLADPADDGLRQLTDDLHVSRHREVRHPGTAKVQQLCVIQVAAGSYGDEQQDVVLTQVAGHADHR